MEKLNKNGYIAGVLVWILAVMFASTRMDCLNYRSCDAVDMFMFGFISISLIAPGWIVAIVVSGITKKEK